MMYSCRPFPGRSYLDRISGRCEKGRARMMLDSLYLLESVSKQRTERLQQESKPRSGRTRRTSRR